MRYNIRSRSGIFSNLAQASPCYLKPAHPEKKTAQWYYDMNENVVNRIETNLFWDKKKIIISTGT